MVIAKKSTILYIFYVCQFLKTFEMLFIMKHMHRFASLLTAWDLYWPMTPCVASPARPGWTPVRGRTRRGDRGRGW